MSSRAAESAWATIRSLRLGGLMLQIHPKSALKSLGWTRAFRQSRSVDAEGRPIPWLSYPFLRFFMPKVQPAWRIFEWGSGYSTVFYARNVHEIVAVEHDETWALRVKSMLPKNGTLVVRTEKASYLDEIKGHGAFDIIVIDGQHREECAVIAAQSLQPQGVIIWDNIEEYTPPATLRDAGFRELPFWGMSPGVIHESCTSVWYRADNCLGI